MHESKVKLEESFPQSVAMIENKPHVIKGEQGILKPHSHDVLSGRGNYVNNHEGNKRFRSLVSNYKQQCVACPKSEKVKFAELIVNEIRSLKPSGRFLKKDESTGLWYDIGMKKTFDKTRQALREGAPTIRKNLGGNDPKENQIVVISASLSNSNEKAIAVTGPMPRSLAIPPGEVISSTMKIDAEDFMVGGEYEPDSNVISTNGQDENGCFLENTKRYLSSLVISDHVASMGNIGADLNVPESIPESIVFEQSTRNFICPSRERFLSDATLSISDLKRNWSDSDLGRLEEEILAGTFLQDDFLEREQSSLKSKSTTASRRNMFTGSIGSNKSESLMIDDSNQTIQSYTRGASSFLDMMSLEDINENQTPHQFIFRFKTSNNDDDNLKNLSGRPRSQSLQDLSVTSSFMKSGRGGSYLFYSLSTNMDGRDNE